MRIHEKRKPKEKLTGLPLLIGPMGDGHSPIIPRPVVCDNVEDDIGTQNDEASRQLAPCANAALATHPSLLESHSVQKGEEKRVNETTATEESANNPDGYEAEDEQAIGSAVLTIAPLECREEGCNEGFRRACDLVKHEKTHNPRPWKCPILTCKYHEYGWPSEKEMDRHCNDKHSLAPALYKCLFPPCLYKSKRESNCKQHMEKAHNWEYTRTKKNGPDKVTYSSEEWSDLKFQAVKGELTSFLRMSTMTIDFCVNY